MNFLKEFLPNQKDRQDFFIAIPIIVLFFGVIFYTSFANNDQATKAIFSGDTAKLLVNTPEAPVIVVNPSTENATVITEQYSATITTKSDEALTEYLLSDKETAEKVDIWLDRMQQETNPDLSFSETPPTKDNDALSKKPDELENPIATGTQTDEQLVIATQATDSSRAVSSKDAAVTADSSKQLNQGQAKDSQHQTTAVSQSDSTLKNEDGKTVATKTEIETGEPTTDENVVVTKTTDANTASKTTLDKDKTEATDKNDKPALASKNDPKPSVTKPAKSATTSSKTKAKISTDPSTWKYKCLIVVGAFERRDYADRLIKRLKKDGQPVHTFYRKGKLAVSIKHSCDSEKALQKALQHAKTRYSKEAWVLRR